MYGSLGSLLRTTTLNLPSGPVVPQASAKSGSLYRGRSVPSVAWSLMHTERPGAPAPEALAWATRSVRFIDGREKALAPEEPAEADPPAARSG